VGRLFLVWLCSFAFSYRPLTSSGNRALLVDVGKETAAGNPTGGYEMRRHDWTTLALISVCALPGLGITSLLGLRFLDSRHSGPEVVEVSDLVSGTKVLRFDSDVVTVRPTVTARPIELRFGEVKLLPLRKSRIEYAFPLGVESTAPPRAWAISEEGQTHLRFFYESPFRR
jgi:hypothetical protein